MHILLLKEKENNFKDQKLLNVNFKMFKKVFGYIDTNNCLIYNWIIEKRRSKKMKKDIKIIALIYVGVALFTYALTLRMERLEGQEDIKNQNKSIVLSIK